MVGWTAMLRCDALPELCFVACWALLKCMGLLTSAACEANASSWVTRGMPRLQTTSDCSFIHACSSVQGCWLLKDLARLQNIICNPSLFTKSFCMAFASHCT